MRRKNANSANSARITPLPSPNVTRMATVRPEPVEWLWPGRIPLGKITILDGDPGLGKSLVTLDVAARVSAGQPMPDTSHSRPPSGVVLMQAEDDPGDTTRPRLDTAGADSLHSTGKGAPVSLGDIVEIGRAVQSVGARLVVVDPVTAFFPSGASALSDQDVRRVMRPLAELAATLKIAIVMVRHLRKARGSAIYAGAGSIGLIGAARSGMLVGPDPTDPDRRVLAQTKSNLAVKPSSLGYRVVPIAHPVLGDIPRIEWLGAVPYTADDLLQSDRTGSKMAQARSFLGRALAPGPLPAKDLEDQAAHEDITKRTLERSRAAERKKGNLQTNKNGQGEWTWGLTAKGRAELIDAIAKGDEAFCDDGGVGGVGGVGDG